MAQAPREVRKRRMPSIYIETFGCQMNEADSRYIAERATSAGYSVVAAAEEANVIVLNTCTVRDNAERRAYGRMNHLNALKRVDPSLRLIVTGCLAEQDRDRMKKLAPHVDAIFGTRELARARRAARHAGNPTSTPWTSATIAPFLRRSGARATR